MLHNLYEKHKVHGLSYLWSLFWEDSSQYCAWIRKFIALKSICMSTMLCSIRWHFLNRYFNSSEAVKLGLGQDICILLQFNMDDDLFYTPEISGCAGTLGHIICIQLPGNHSLVADVIAYNWMWVSNCVIILDFHPPALCLCFMHCVWSDVLAQTAGWCESLNRDWQEKSLVKPS